MENSSIALQEAADSTSYALAHWDELGDIPGTHFELIPEFLEYGTEEELRILKRLQPSRRIQRRLFELRRMVHPNGKKAEGGAMATYAAGKEGNEEKGESNGVGFLVDDPVRLFIGRF